VRVLALREGEPATSPATILKLRQLLRGMSVPVGAGSDCNFCELNREQALGRLALKEADFLFWSVNPQVHATDHLSIMETLEAQAATVRSARAFGGQLPLVVSPVTLKQRFNPVATGVATPHGLDELPPEVDTRQLSQWAAAWTIGCLVALAEGGVESVTMFETTGWRGVMERASGSESPARFPSHPGKPFPIFDVLKLVTGIRAGQDCSSRSRAGMSEIGFFARGNLQQLVVANLRPEARRIRWTGSSVAGLLSPLKPYAVAALTPTTGEQNRWLES
jgi:hypothetical protein